MNQTADWFTVDPETSPHFDKNRICFSKRYSQQMNLVEKSGTGLKEYEFKRLQKGQYACRQMVDGQPYDIYPSSWFEQANIQQFQRVKEMLKRGVALFFIAGSGLGYLYSDIQDSLKEKKNASVVFIETRPELILAQFCLFDCREAIDFPDFHWVIDESIYPTLQERLHNEALYTIDRNRIVSFPERVLTPKEGADYSRLSRWYVSQQQQYRLQLQQFRVQYDQRVSRPADLKAGTVWTAGLLDAYAHTPLLRSLASGFAGHGMKDVFFSLTQGCTSDERITHSLLEHCPDMYLFLHLATKRVIPKELSRPRIVWYLDHPKHYEWEINRREFHEQDFIFYSDRQYAPYFEEANVGGAFHLTVCPSLSHRGAFRPELAAPVMFVGSHTAVETMTQHLPGSVRDDLFHLADVLTHNPTLGVNEAAANLKLTDKTMHIFQSMAEAYTSTIQREFRSGKDKLEYFFYSFTNSYKRERYIRALLDSGLIIYGPDSWLEFLGDKYADRFRGWLGYEDLADAYASAQICINIHSLQCPTCLNSRDFDVLSAGGCLVTDEVEDLHAGYLQPDHDLKMYSSPEELAHTVQELLDNEPLREALREQGNQTVQTRHLPQHRAQVILEALQSKGWR